METAIEKIDTHLFQYPWSLVVKGFWQKYPSKQLNFVKFNHVIDFEIPSADIIKFTRLMYCKISFLPLFSYSVEDITINLKEKALEMKSVIIKNSPFLPTGKEHCSYLSHNLEGNDFTKYTKSVLSSNKISKFLHYFATGFKQGCQVVEEKIQQIEK